MAAGTVAYREPVTVTSLLRAAGTLTLGLALALPTTVVVAAPSLATDEDPLAPFATQTLTWQRCAAGQCAWLTVPLDYADPTGATIRIRVSRAPASGPLQERLGSLVVNPGGPGASGVEFAPYLARTLSPDVTGRYDIVGFDPRGVGASEPITCLTGPQTTRWQRTDVTPDTPAEVRTLMRRAGALAQSCLDLSPTIARHVGSTETVRDMDLLREVLGDERLNLLGFSYGTYLGTRYAELFPDRVGRFVLDGAVDPRLDIMQLSRDQSRGFQEAIERFARDCSQRRDCPWTGDPASVLDGISRLLADLDARPLPARSGRTLVQSEGLTAAFYAMYSPSLWPLLRTGLAQARRGNGTGLLALNDLATDRTGPNTYGSNMASAFPAIVCWDGPPTPGPAGLADAARRWSRTTRVPAMAQALAWGNAPCSVWFGHSPVAPAPARSTTTSPLVIIGGRHDPATPYRWAQALARQLPTSTLITYTGDGHTVYGNGVVCIDRPVDRYLVSGTPPEPGIVCR